MPPSPPQRGWKWPGWLLSELLLCSSSRLKHQENCPGLAWDLLLGLFCALPPPAPHSSAPSAIPPLVPHLAVYGWGLGWSWPAPDGYRESLWSLELVKAIWQWAQPALSIPQQRHRSPSRRDPETEPRQTQIYLDITKDVIEGKRERRKSSWLFRGLFARDVGIAVSAKPHSSVPSLNPSRTGGTSIPNLLIPWP